MQVAEGVGHPSTAINLPPASPTHSGMKRGHDGSLAHGNKSPGAPPFALFAKVGYHGSRYQPLRIPPLNPKDGFKDGSPV